MHPSNASTHLHAPTIHPPTCRPTDFSGLFPKAASLAAQQQQHVARGPATFADIAGGRGGGAGGRAVLAELPGGNWLPPALPALAPDATHLTAAGAGAAGGDRTLPPAPAPPLDWSLKTNVRFASPLPFSVAEDAALLPARQALEAQRAFTACHAGPGAPLSLEQRYLAALHSWQFPADPWAQPAAGAAKLRGPPPEVLQRRTDWQAAFASLYDALRCGACDAFYYLSPEVGASVRGGCCGTCAASFARPASIWQQAAAPRR